MLTLHTSFRNVGNVNIWCGLTGPRSPAGTGRPGRGNGVVVKAVSIREHGGPEVLEWVEAEDPAPAAGEVVIDVAASALNRADVMQRRGLYPLQPGWSPYPGLEVSGRIGAIGEGVTGWKVGDEVCALLTGGGYAQKVAVPAGQLLTIPEGVGLTEAAGLPEAGRRADRPPGRRRRRAPPHGGRRPPRQDPAGERRKRVTGRTPPQGRTRGRMPCARNPAGRTGAFGRKEPVGPRASPGRAGDRRGTPAGRAPSRVEPWCSSRPAARGAASPCGHRPPGQ